jgi:hypothetical protein
VRVKGFNAVHAMQCTSLMSVYDETMFDTWCKDTWCKEVGVGQQYQVRAACQGSQCDHAGMDQVELVSIVEHLVRVAHSRAFRGQLPCQTQTRPSML